MEEQLNAGIHTESGKSLMNAFLRARTAFGFEYLIRFRAAHSDAERDISLNYKFKLNTAILEFDRFKVRKNPIFHNASWRPQMVRFVLVMLRAA